jgi:hypothetical protein
VHVRRQPVDQPHRAERRRVGDHEHEADRAGEAKQHAENAGGHWSTRTSSGSRPIRSISRYATAHTAPPTSRITVPSVES